VVVGDWNMAVLLFSKSRVVRPGRVIVEYGRQTVCSWGVGRQ
jgi:hypothetical protein